MAQRDLDFQFQDVSVKFLFSEREPEDKGFEAQLSCRADNWTAAVSRALDEIVPPILDTVAVQMHTPLMLGTPTRVLKGEPGARRRKVILINKKTLPTICKISPEIASRINAVLATESKVPRPALRWLRNSYRPLPIRDRFVFAWLALENLAGAKDVVKTCPQCNFSFPPFRSANRDGAFEVLRSVDAGVEKKEFDRWWYDLRNAVFHGSKEPGSRFLAELRQVSDRILLAVNKFVERQAELDFAFRRKVPVTNEDVYYRHHFLEFDCHQPEEEFAPEVPNVDRLEEVIDRQGETRRLMNGDLLSWSETETW